jgi:DNA-binding GntR family transcriptional regulator
VRAVATNQSLTETAYESLRADLLACRLAPGEKLNINDLSSRLKVSLGAVREALSRLTAEELVTLEAHRGFRAAPVSVSELHDLTSTRIEIESSCLRRAIDIGDVEWETGIVGAFHRLSRTPERAAGAELQINEDWSRAHKAFHRALVAACDSPWRLRLRDYLYDQTERYRRLSVPASADTRDLGAEHRALMEATLARDSDRAVQLLQQHFRVTAGLVASLAAHERGEVESDTVASLRPEPRPRKRTPVALAS